MHWGATVCGVMGALSGLYWLINLVASVKSVRKVPYLRDVAVAERETWPRVSLIIAACNEEATLGPALQSRLTDDYPALEVIVVNDRSTDGTGAIADAIAARDPRVRVVHVTHLPPEWLGKLHAMHQGVLHATGEWLLFSDADVHVTPSTLRKAITQCEARGCDHLALIPSIWSNSLILDAVFSVFLRGLLVAGQIWRVEDPNSKAAVGGGLFNLLRRETYDRTAGFEWLKLEIADDIMLARMIKQSGGRTTVVNGVGCVGLDFYRDLRDMAKGMEKGAFAIFGNYNIVRLYAIVVVFVVNECGWIAALAHPQWRWLGLATLALIVPTEVIVSRWTERRLFPSLLAPLGVLLQAWFFLRSGYYGVRRGGVVWRGTLYPTPMLRAGRRVRLFE